MFNDIEKNQNLQDWQKKELQLYNELTDENKDIYTKYLNDCIEIGTSEQGVTIDFYENWLSNNKSLEIFIIPSYCRLLQCYNSSYKLKIMELYLKFIILSNFRIYSIENYLEKLLWENI